MPIVLKNNSSDSFSYLNGLVVVPASGELSVDSTYWFNLLVDVSFITDVRQNNLVINDGFTDYRYPESEDVLRRVINVENTANRDSDGATIVRQKAARKGWSFWALPPEITTSTIGGSLYCKDSLGVDVPGFTCKIYNANGEEITTPGLSNINLTTCVKTVLDFEPAFDYEIVGGMLRLATNPSQDVRLWIVGAPDIPVSLGGSKEFASGINLRFLPSGSVFEVDGRVTKYITHDSTTHQGKLRILLNHPAGVQVNIQFVIHMYRL